MRRYPEGGFPVYGNLPRYLRELPAPPEPTLEAMADAWFGTVPGS